MGKTAYLEALSAQSRCVPLTTVKFPSEQKQRIVIWYFPVITEKVQVRKMSKIQ